MKKRRALQTMADAAVGFWALASLGACSSRAASFHSLDISGAADYGRDFSLTDHHGALRHLQDFHGKVVLLFFGYTQCPLACPTTLIDLAHTKQLLGPDGDRVQVLFVTLDPQRDTPQRLKDYMENFDPGFLALYTSAAQTAAVARAFKIYYQEVPGATASSYSVDHSVGSYVYDTRGRLRLFMRYGTKPELAAQDIRHLLQTGA